MIASSVREYAGLAPLHEVMAYQNLNVVRKFMEYWDVSEDEAQELFEETKKWLWMSADSISRREEGEEMPELAITFSMTLLDEMWHTFILFTMEYKVFCHKYFGFYLNHAPTTWEQKEAAKAELESDPDGFLAKVEASTEAQYSYIYDVLGESTLVKWYSEWTDKVTPDYLSSIRKNPW